MCSEYFRTLAEKNMHYISLAFLCQEEVELEEEWVTASVFWYWIQAWNINGETGVVCGTVLFLEKVWVAKAEGTQAKSLVLTEQI